MAKDLISKKTNGQYFTTTNPFKEDAFLKWFKAIPSKKRQIIIEPFAGSNNIVQMINELKFKKPQWYCYDIEIQENNAVPEIEIIQQDTIENFPVIKNAYVAITNPPYLAKNSATRNHLDFKYPEYDDLYKKCLEVMLKNCEYVAAIIPESFITAGLFHNRLKSVISLTCKMFEDTECPVCLALFSPEKKKTENGDFEVFRQGQQERIGTYSELNALAVKSETNKKNWIFNDPNGSLGILCCDDTKKATIRFVPGDEIDPSCIKVSSRAKTRISGLPDEVDLNKFIKKCNAILNKYRAETNDVFLTSFKGLRDDKMYRRRLDFETAKNIMGRALEEVI